METCTFGSGKVVFLAVTIVVNLAVEIFFAVHRGMFFEWTNSIESMRKFIIAKSINPNWHEL